jgi:hypothetical protein
MWRADLIRQPFSLLALANSVKVKLNVGGTIVTFFAGRSRRMVSPRLVWAITRFLSQTTLFIPSSLLPKK